MKYFHLSNYNAIYASTVHSIITSRLTTYTEIFRQRLNAYLLPEYIKYAVKILAQLLGLVHLGQEKRCDIDLHSTPYSTKPLPIWIRLTVSNNRQIRHKFVFCIWL